MSWVVPTGCYYAVNTPSQPSFNVFTYYGPGQTVPDNEAPSNDYNGRVCFILADFDNGYIYTSVFCSSTYEVEITFDTTNKSFVARHLWTDAITITQGPIIDVIGSDRCATQLHFVLSGDTFTFGDGTGMLNRSDFLGSSNIPYALRYTFYSRYDLTTCTIPTGAEFFYYSFTYCRNLQSVSPQNIPAIQCALGMFYSCTSLTTAPTFLSVAPNGIVNYANPNWAMYIYASCQRCYAECQSLVTAPVIPNKITRIKQMFEGCTSLAGAVVINTNEPTQETMADMFNRTTNEIVLLGTSNLLADIASSYNNVYVWSLSQTMSVQRNPVTQTDIDISVDVSRFNTGNLISLNLYRDNGTTPLLVTWNDPTLEISNIPTVLTTSITNVSENDAFTLSVIATDQYGSANPVSVRIPIGFFTIDVRAGGKEIAFGASANDDLTNYPDGLFKCGMNFIDMKMIGEIKMYAGLVIPNGWLLCDGSEILISDYPLLYSAIGDTWGVASDNDHFVLPNFVGRMPLGASDINTTEWITITGENEYSSFILDSPTYARWGTGTTWYYKMLDAGEYFPTYTNMNTLFGGDPASGVAKCLQVALNVASNGGYSWWRPSVNDMPTHLHSQPSHTHFSGLHTVPDRFGAGSRDAAGAYTGYSGQVAINTGGAAPNTNNAGGGRYISQMPPFAVINYIICAA